MSLFRPNPFATRIYLAGPISGVPDDNRKMFETVTGILRADGFEVVNPHELEHNLRAEQEKFSFEDFIRLDFKQGIIAKQCNAIVLLPGWPRSRGALSAELPYFACQGYPVGYWDTDIRDVIWMHSYERSM